jgi:hypothetical protein
MGDAMADSDDESLDISKTLLNTDLSLPSISAPSSAKPTQKSGHKTAQDHESTDFLDIFSNKTLGPSKLNGSSFKNMGTGIRAMSADW